MQFVQTMLKLVFGNTQTKLVTNKGLWLLHSGRHDHKYQNDPCQEYFDVAVALSWLTAAQTYLIYLACQNNKWTLRHWLTLEANYTSKMLSGTKTNGAIESAVQRAHCATVSLATPVPTVLSTRWSTWPTPTASSRRAPTCPPRPCAHRVEPFSALKGVEWKYIWKWIWSGNGWKWGTICENLMDWIGFGADCPLKTIW